MESSAGRCVAVERVARVIARRGRSAALRGGAGVRDICIDEGGVAASRTRAPRGEHRRSHCADGCAHLSDARGRHAPTRDRRPQRSQARGRSAGRWRAQNSDACSGGSRQSGASWRASLTARLTGRYSSAGAAGGLAQSACSSLGRRRRVDPGASLAGGSRITGMRSCSARTGPAAAVVTIAQERSGSTSRDAPFGRHDAHSPANANGSPSGAGDPVRHAAGPLVEAVGDDQAAAALEGVAVGRALGDRLGAGVDRLGGDLARSRTPRTARAPSAGSAPSGSAPPSSPRADRPRARRRRARR